MKGHLQQLLKDHVTHVHNIPASAPHAACPPLSALEAECRRGLYLLGCGETEKSGLLPEVSGGLPLTGAGFPCWHSEGAGEGGTGHSHTLRISPH